MGDFQKKRGKDEILEVVTVDGGSDTVWLDGDSYSGLVKGDDIFPITLTTEILEKNGFKKNGIPNSIASIKEMGWCDDTYVWSRQETPDERMFVSVYMDDPYNFFVEVICQYCHVDGIHVKYVHELQRVLKICNIYKEIVL